MRFESITGELRRGTVCECKRFDDLTELFAACPDARLESTTGDISGERIKWVGRKIADRDELLRFASQVWHDGMDMLDAAKSRVSAATMPEPKTRRRRARFDEFDGDDICLDRLRDGAPFWRTTSREFSNGASVITLAVGIGASGAVSADAIIWRGIAAIVLTELLEAAGYRVAIVGFDASIDAFEDGSDTFVSVDMKDASDPLDVVTLVNSLSSWAFRTVGLGALGLSFEGREHSPGYGRSCGIKLDRFATLYGQNADVMIDHVWDEFAAVELIESTLAKLDNGTLAAV